MWDDRLQKANEKQTPWPLNSTQKKYKDLFQNSIDDGSIVLKDVKFCPCGSSDLEPLTSIDRFGLPFGSKICKACGLVLTDPIISEESIPLFYEKYYHPLTFGNENPDVIKYLFGKNQGTKIFNKLINHITKKEINVLEIGCGAGFNLSDFKQLSESYGINTQAYGIEYSTKYVEYGREKLRLNLMQGGLECLDNSPILYDIVILSHVFEHFVDLTDAIAKIKSVIHENSLIYIEVPGIMDLKLKYEYDCDILKYFTCAHTYNFSLGTLSNIMSLDGFDIIEGNEKIEAMFSLNINNYNKTINYLGDLESNLAFYQSKNKIHRKVIKKIRTIIR